MISTLLLLYFIYAENNASLSIIFFHARRNEKNHYYWTTHRQTKIFAYEDIHKDLDEDKYLNDTDKKKYDWMKVEIS